MSREDKPSFMQRDNSPDVVEAIDFFLMAQNEREDKGEDDVPNIDGTSRRKRKRPSERYAPDDTAGPSASPERAERDLEKVQVHSDVSWNSDEEQDVVYCGKTSPDTKIVIEFLAEPVAQPCKCYFRVGESVQFSDVIPRVVKKMGQGLDQKDYYCFYKDHILDMSETPLSSGMSYEIDLPRVTILIRLLQGCSEGGPDTHTTRAEVL